MSKHVSIYDIYFWNLDIKGFGGNINIQFNVSYCDSIAIYKIGGGVNRTVERISESSCKIAYQRCASTLVAVFIRDSKSFYISLKLLDVVKETRSSIKNPFPRFTVVCWVFSIFAI